MNRDDIIRMAREAGFEVHSDDVWITDGFWVKELERFAKLVAAAERGKWQWEELHTCHPHCDRPACVAVRRAREDEREMCAAICAAIRKGEM
jgi:hypothetical protein